MGSNIVEIISLINSGHLVCSIVVHADIPLADAVLEDCIFVTLAEECPFI